MMATKQSYAAEEAAGRVIPCVAPLAVDPVPEVRHAALATLEAFVKLLQEHSATRDSAAGPSDAAGGAQQVKKRTEKNRKEKKRKKRKEKKRKEKKRKEKKRKEKKRKEKKRLCHLCSGVVYGGQVCETLPPTGPTGIPLHDVLTISAAHSCCTSALVRSCFPPGRLAADPPQLQVLHSVLIVRCCNSASALRGSVANYPNPPTRICATLSTYCSFEG